MGRKDGEIALERTGGRRGWWLKLEAKQRCCALHEGRLEATSLWLVLIFNAKKICIFLICFFFILIII